MATARLTNVQSYWHDVASDQSLDDLPYIVETNAHGQLLLRPRPNRHSMRQAAIMALLERHTATGRSYSEFALATSEGVKVPDVVWMSPERFAEMDATGDPSTLAPEICVEVLSLGNTPEEMADRRALYRSIGAEEVWIVTDDGQIRFYRDAEIDRSGLVPECPERIQAKPK
ncbi:MAG: Uma2 family endonuclease [Longimonas sp.]|uniref:Uma2 family endonuclease n=1 Tax=Longimonas sp. TaxID=2039626 RepID=UPI00334EF810